MRRFDAYSLRVSSVLLATVLLSACGGSSVTGGATPQPTHVRHHKAAGADTSAIAVARRFLTAFERGNRAVELSLMSKGLLARNVSVPVAAMLGVQTVPSRIDILRARTFRSRHGHWTRVIARLDFDHGTVIDRLAVIHTAGGYRVSRITKTSS